MGYYETPSYYDRPSDAEFVAAHGTCAKLPAGSTVLDRTSGQIGIVVDESADFGSVAVAWVPSCDVEILPDVCLAIVDADVRGVAIEIESAFGRATVRPAEAVR